MQTGHEILNDFQFELSDEIRHTVRGDVTMNEWRMICRLRVKGEVRGRRKIVCSDVQRCSFITFHRNTIDQRTATKLNYLYNKLKATLLMTVSERVTPGAM
jgi:hypothetical protein